jgi:hypothetical protein
LGAYSFGIGDFVISEIGVLAELEESVVSKGVLDGDGNPFLTIKSSVTELEPCDGFITYASRIEILADREREFLMAFFHKRLAELLLGRSWCP